MNKLAVVNMDTARAYINGYLSNSHDCEPVDCDVDGAADALIDFMDVNRIDLFSEVPADTFVDILESHTLK